MSPNTKAQTRKTVLLDERVAINAYLDSLLQEIPDELDEAPPAVVAPAPAPVVAVPQVAPPQVRVETAVEAQPVPPAASETVVPEWAEGTFQCLLFKVAGLMVAVPLVKLNGIVRWPEEVTPMPGHQPWFLGIFNHHGRNVRVVDTAGVILPKDRLSADRPKPTHIILIDGGNWGLACDAVAQMVTLRPEDVRWRGARSQRPWLAGTVIQHMCAILDVEPFAVALERGDWVAQVRAGQAGKGKEGGVPPSPRPDSGRKRV